MLLRHSLRTAALPIRGGSATARIPTATGAPAVGLHHCRSHATFPAVTSLSEEEQLLQEEVRRFSREVVGPKVEAMDEAEQMDPQLLEDLFDAGFMGVETPPDLGGAGMGFMSAILVIEELAKVDPAVSVCVDVQNTLVGTAIKTWGNEAQKAKFLPRLAQDTLGSFSLSEWGSGSDAFAMGARAVEDGDSYLLNGTKAWVTNAGEANIFIVMANANPAAGYKGITAFLVDNREQQGLNVSKKEKKLGIRASSTCELTLDNLRVPKENILGEFGKGYKIAIEVLNEGRIGIAAQMLGLAEGAFENTMEYITQRKQFGSKISDFQGVQFQYAEMAVDIETAKLLTYNAARLKEEGKPFVSEAAMAKLRASQVAERVASQCVNLMGGVGFTREAKLEKYFRDCKIGQIYEGTSNIQLQTIAKSLANQY